MSPLNGRSLSASLTVRDLERSLAWYRDVAGFEVAQKYERDGQLRAVSLKAGAVRVLLGQDDGKKGWDRVKGEGFSLQITTNDSIDDVAARIRQSVGALETEPTDMPWGARMFRVRDPDGFILVISSERPQTHEFTPGLDGWITHTDIASTDAAATRAFCEQVFGWRFQPPFPSPNGEYHLFAYSELGGGGIGSAAPGQEPRSIPFVHVADAQQAYEAALAAGAASLSEPERVMEGVTVAIVRAPGGVTIGLSGP